MFLEKINKSPNLGLKYLLGFFIIALFYAIGQFPFAIALIVKSFTSGKAMPITEAGIMKFFSPNVTLFLMLLIFVFTMLGIIIVVKYIHKMNIHQLKAIINNNNLILLNFRKHIIIFYYMPTT